MGIEIHKRETMQNSFVRNKEIMFWRSEKWRGIFGARKRDWNFGQPSIIAA